MHTMFMSSFRHVCIIINKILVTDGNTFSAEGQARQAAGINPRSCIPTVAAFEQSVNRIKEYC